MASNAEIFPFDDVIKFIYNTYTVLKLGHHCACWNSEHSLTVQVHQQALCWLKSSQVIFCVSWPINDLDPYYWSLNIIQNVRMDLAESRGMSRVSNPFLNDLLTHWGRVRLRCASKLNISGSDSGLSSGRRQAIIWTNAGILLIWPLGTNFREILNEIHTISFKNVHLKMLWGN